MIAPKGSNFSNQTVYLILAGAAALILILGCGFVYLIVGSLGDGGGSLTKGGQKVNPKATYPSGEDASGLKPEQVANAFLNDLREDRLSDAYQRTSVGFQGSMSQNDFNEFVSKNKALIGHVTWRHTQTGKSADGSRTFKGNVGGGLHGSTDFTLEIGPEDEGWRVRRFSVP